MRRDSETLIELVKLAFIWSSAGLAAVVCISVIFTLFLGHSRVALNDDIYEGYLYPNAPHSTDLETHEGWGLTTYGENGLVVNKQVRSDADHLLFLGDSFVQARQVSDRFKFTEIVERKLNEASPDRPTQCLNFGFVGQGLGTYISFSRNFDQRYQPRRVFVLVSQRDFVEIYQSAEFTKRLETDDQPMLVEQKTYSRLEKLVNNLGLRGLGIRLRLQAEAFIEETGARDTEQEVLASLETEDAFRASIELQLRQLQKIWGDRLTLIYHESIPDLGRAAPQQLCSPVLDVARELSICTINLYPALLAEYKRFRPTAGFANSRLGSGHLNKYGHEVVANEILKYLNSEHAVF